MKIFDKAMELSEKIIDKAEEFSGDEIIADTIIKAVEKQEKVNRVLESKGCNYRVNGIDLSAGIPPTVTFNITKVEAESVENNDTRLDNLSFEA